jgi:hypothetical protein
MAATNEIQLTPTSLPHIFLCDVSDTGILREIAVVKRLKDGTIYYIDIDPMHSIDKARLKKIVSSPHADKYELWDLMSQARLSNGMNALDFFHSNYVKVKRPRGAVAATESIMTVPLADDRLIGSEFTNPAEAKLDPATKQFMG